MAEPMREKGFYRTTGTDAVLGGVCGGLAQRLHAPAWTIRVIWVLGTLISFGAGIVAYIVLWVATPGEEAVTGKTKPAPESGPVYR